MLDIAWVLAFVAIGRASHAHGDSAEGLASTSWPFLSGLVVGWLAVTAWRRPWPLWPTGMIVWLATVGVGMALRVVAGQGTALAFVFVALGFLALGLLGWRMVAWMTLGRVPGSGPVRPGP